MLLGKRSRFNLLLQKKILNNQPRSASPERGHRPLQPLVATSRGEGRPSQGTGGARRSDAVCSWEREPDLICWFEKNTQQSTYSHAGGTRFRSCSMAGRSCSCSKMATSCSCSTRFRSRSCSTAGRSSSYSMTSRSRSFSARDRSCCSYPSVQQWVGAAPA